MWCQSQGRPGSWRTTFASTTLKRTTENKEKEKEQDKDKEKEKEKEKEQEPEKEQEKEKDQEKPDLPSYKGRTYTIQEFNERVKSKGPKGLAQEYIAMRAEVQDLLLASSTDAFHNNKTRNRYADTPILDNTRVRLKDGLGTDYINASYVLNEAGRMYICASGPLEGTAADFWRMVWQEKVLIIVMLCSPVEEGKDKCFQYWGKTTGDTLNFDSFSIQTVSRGVNCGFQTTQLRVMTPLDKTGKGRLILHLGFYDWPDQGQPQCESSLCQLHDLMERAYVKLCDVNKVDKTEAKMVLHCSAGIGRTGTLMSFCIAAECIRNSPFPVQVPDVCDVVRYVRSQRPYSVQQPGQYLFVYTTVMEYLVQENHVTSEELGLEFLKAEIKKLVELVAAKRASSRKQKPL